MDFFSDEARRNPFPLYDRIRGASPVLHEPRTDSWMIFDYEGVKQAMQDNEAFSSSLIASIGRPTPQWMIFMDPPRHTKLRGLIMRAFTPRVVAGLEPRIRELARQLLDPVIDNREMDWAAEFAVPLPMMVIAGMIGIPAADWPQFRRWSDVILKLSYTISAGDAATAASREYFAVAEEMNAYLPALIEQRRARPADDLLTKLVEAEVDGERLSYPEILGFFQLLLVAGNETTTNLLNNAVLCLTENPDQLTRLRTAPDLLPSAIEEVLRYRSPFQWIFRGTTREVQVSGHIIPAHRLVLPIIGSANRDPRQFPDANRFDITRDPNPHVAFGHGAHFCIGAPLSRLEARVALTEFLQRVDQFELATAEPWPPRKALHVHGPDRLPIRFEPARHATSTSSF